MHIDEIIQTSMNYYYSLSMNQLILHLIPTLIVAWIITAILSSNINRYLMGLPAVQGSLPFFGQVFTMIKGSPWDTMATWVHEYGTVFTFHLFGSASGMYVGCLYACDMLVICL